MPDLAPIECKMYLVGNSKDDAMERCPFGEYSDADRYRREEHLEHIYSVIAYIDTTTIESED
jgi:hypothetical protein